LPHRKAGGVDIGHSGKHAGELLSSPQSVYLTLGVDPEFDAANPAEAVASLRGADDVVSLSAYLSPAMRECASVVLPISVSTETFGTWVNAAGIWQTSKGIVAAPGQARPGWKVLRVLGDLLALDGFNYSSPEEITAEVQQQCENVTLDNAVSASDVALQPELDTAFVRAGETPLYATDPVVRRSVPLQKTSDAKSALFATLCADDANRLGLSDGGDVKVRQSWGQNGSQRSGETTLPVRIDDSVPVGSVWVPTGIAETATLGALFTPVELTKA